MWNIKTLKNNSSHMIKCLNVARRQHCTTVEQPIEMNVLRSPSIFQQTLHEQSNKPNYHNLLLNVKVMSQSGI